MTRVKRFVAMAAAAFILIGALNSAFWARTAWGAFSPPVTALRIGMFYDSTVLPSANLQNYAGAGHGFEFGYFNSAYAFVPIGAFTQETAISILMDRNMTWVPGVGGGSGEYRENADGSIVVGCFHIQMNASYDSFEEALSVAEEYEDSFVKYAGGRFYVCISNYTTWSEAADAIVEKDIGGFSVNAGTANTLSVVKTGTSKVLFEYDGEGTRHLGVMPLARNSSNEEVDVMCQTWFKGYRYQGGFQYARRTGEKITVVQYIDIEPYVKGVIPYEMNNAWPLEALKAQACCARTYALATLNRHNTYGFDLCTTDHCQVYYGRGSANDRTDRAVDETAGMYITYQGKLCETYYSSSNGGGSESCENVWSSAIPYLRGIVDPYEADVASRIPGYNWTVTYTAAELTQRLRSRGYDCASIVSLEVSRYTPTGNVFSVTATDANGKAWVFSRRDKLIPVFGLQSQRFNIGAAVPTGGGIYANDPAKVLDSGAPYYAIDSAGNVSSMKEPIMYAITGEEDVEIVSGEGGASSGGNGMINGVFTIKGMGRGHHVGMSQWGAYSMAEYHGKSYIEIIKFYYTGVDVG